MERYELQVLDHGERVIAARAVELSDPRALWRSIHRIARQINRPGLMIKVTNSAGKIIILVGVASALRLWAEMSGILPPM